MTFRPRYVIQSYQKLILIVKTQYVLFYAVYVKIISKVKHHNKTKFPYKFHIPVEAASGHNVSHKMLNAFISVALTAYVALFAFTGKCKLIVHCTVLKLVLCVAGYIRVQRDKDTHFLTNNSLHCVCVKNQQM
jgi:hypothetical protein